MMINSKTLSLLLLTTATAVSFTPAAQRSGLTNGRTQLFMGNNKQFKDQVDDVKNEVRTDFKDQVDEFKKTVNQNAPKVKNQIDRLGDEMDDNTPFLFVDVKKAKDNLAKNWGWIMGSGALNMVLGALALLLPATATGAAYTGTVLTIGATGVVGFVNAVLAKNKDYRLKSALSSIGYGALAFYMGTHPGVGLDIITLTIAAVIFAEGFYETALAIKNENLHARGWHFVSGIVSAFAGLGLSAATPAASLVVPGAALGLRLTSNGASKLAIGLTGKEIADERKKNKLSS